MFRMPDSREISFLLCLLPLMARVIYAQAKQSARHYCGVKCLMIVRVFTFVERNPLIFALIADAYRELFFKEANVTSIYGNGLRVEYLKKFTE